MPATGTDLTFARACLNQQLTVAIPTETVYGLAANALSENAVTGIFRIKNRPAFDPLIVHVASLQDAGPYVKYIPDVVRRLYAVLGPGPVTYILPKTSLIPDLVTSGHETVGIRIPDHPMTLELLRSLDFPLAAPSANPFGFVSPTTAQHVADQLGDAVGYILDGGPCRIGLESTILDASGPELIVLRLGGLSLEALETAAGEKISQIRLSSSNPTAPGMLLKHYNPGKTVLLGDLKTLAQTAIPAETGILAFREALPGFPAEHQRILSPSGDMEEAARQLFAHLRAFSAMDIKVVLAESVPETGLGRAINDRLRRAAEKG